MYPLAWVFVVGLVGLLIGLVLRWRGACLLPILLGVLVTGIYVYDAIDGGINEGRGGDPVPLVVVLFFFYGPFLLLAGVGALLGARLRDRS